MFVRGDIRKQGRRGLQVSGRTYAETECGRVDLRVTRLRLSDLLLLASAAVFLAAAY